MAVYSENRAKRGKGKRPSAPMRRARPRNKNGVERSETAVSDNHRAKRGKAKWPSRPVARTRVGVERSETAVSDIERSA